MGRQRNIFQMKEEDQATARDQSKMDRSNMRLIENLTPIIIKILTGLEKRVEDISETLNTEIKKRTSRN